MAPATVNVLDRVDIQGLFARAYAQLPFARYLLYTVTDAAGARRALADLATRVTHAAERPESTAVNVALTHAGLEALGLDEETRATFAFEFREGMTAPHRRIILGDYGADAPEHWAWGGPDTDRVDLLLLLYAADLEELGRLETEVAAAWPEGALHQVGDAMDASILRDLDTGTPREHFGFADGISQPDVEGLGDPKPGVTQVRSGEFLLGYTNEYGRLTARPLVDASRDPEGVLPVAADEGGRHDLGRNGTYLVFRQLRQDVTAYWRTMDEAVRSGDGAADPSHARVRLASKLMGRWPSGAPLVRAPEADRPELAGENGFGYHHEDPEGMACPIGAHIRRANPRDSLAPGPGTEKSRAVNRLHQLLRRGRTYGTPISPTFSPEEILASDGAGERGLFFISLDANIVRQFEFVQHTWLNNPKFGDLYEDTDPLIGVREPAGALRGGTFTIPDYPVRRRLTSLPSFVQMRGGAYFFMPGIRALRYLATLDGAPEARA